MGKKRREKRRVERRGKVGEGEERGRLVGCGESEGKERGKERRG